MQIEEGMVYAHGDLADTPLVESSKVDIRDVAPVTYTLIDGVAC